MSPEQRRADRYRLVAELEKGPRTTFQIRALGISANPSQRVRELRDEGYRIDQASVKKGRRRGLRYVLVSKPGEHAVGPPEPPPAGGVLSEAEPPLFNFPPRPLNPHTDEEEAA